MEQRGHTRLAYTSKAMEAKAAGILSRVQCRPHPLILGAAQVPEIVILAWVSSARGGAWWSDQLFLWV